MPKGITFGLQSDEQNEQPLNPDRNFQGQPIGQIFRYN